MSSIFRIKVLKLIDSKDVKDRHTTKKHVNNGIEVKCKVKLLK